MVFRGRADAALQLSRKLERFEGQRPLVLGIPRGSVPMAAILADRLHGELDVVLVHKIGAPENPEFAIASVSEFGSVYRSRGIEFYELSEAELDALAESELERLRKRRRMLSPIRTPISPAGRVVIIVDDGIATGATMIAAVRAIRAQNPKRIVVAAPVASREAATLLRSEADEVVLLDIPEDFFAISQFYLEFPQVTDEEVSRILSDAAKAA